MEEQKNMLSPRLLVALSMYLTSLIAANTLGVKLMPFLFGTHLSVAVFSFPFVFLMTDIVGEVYGKRVARMFVLAGIISVIAWLVFSLISIAMPWSKGGLWVHDSYNQVFGLSIRFAIASVAAFIVAEYQDIIAFFFFRRKMGTRHFWLRSNLSNLWSQFLDTAIFMTIAFAGVRPWGTIIAIIIPWWLYKVAMGALYTPFSYVGIRLLSKKHERTGDTN